MIAQLTGNFLHKTPTRVIVDVQGVGYEVNISLHTFEAINQKDRGTLLIYLKVSEDAMTMYGFADMAEKDIFLKLLSVSGVGASTARMMISSLKPSEIQQAIASSNIKLLESIKGIGKKTAERIALELRDKIGTVPVSETNQLQQHNTAQSETLEALMALGIGKAIAEQAIKKAMKQLPETSQVEDLIKLALKSL